MFGIGPGELILIFLIALFVLGPERLPSTARDLGRAMNELRKASDELTRDFLNADRDRPAGTAPPAPAVAEPATPPRAIEASAPTTEVPPSEPTDAAAPQPEDGRPDADR